MIGIYVVEHECGVNKSGEIDGFTVWEALEQFSKLFKKSELHYMHNTSYGVKYLSIYRGRFFHLKFYEHSLVGHPFIPMEEFLMDNKEGVCDICLKDHLP